MSCGSGLAVALDQYCDTAKAWVARCDVWVGRSISGRPGYAGAGMSRARCVTAGPGRYGGLQRRLIETRRTMPIVFLTGQADIPMSVQAMKAGASNFLMKPVSAQALRRAIRLAMDEARVACGSRIDIN
ncbi:MAG: response regulator [Candidatus Binataceae bacterium]